MAKIIAQGQKVELRSSSRIRWCVRRDRKPVYEKCIPSASVPQPLSCTVARLLHRFWLVNEVFPDSDEGRITFQTDSGREIVVLSLEVNEELCFNIGNAIALTRNARLWTSLDLSWGALAVGKTLVHHAVGPCEIAIELSGACNSVVSSDASFTASRLVAWTPRPVTFGVCGIRRVGDVVLNDVLVSACFDPGSTNACVLLNSEMANHKSSAGNALWRLLIKQHSFCKSAAY